MCFDDDSQPPLPPGTPGEASGKDLILSAADGNQFAAYIALPQGPARAQVVVLPDIRGLHQFYKDLALRFAEQGIAAISFDYYARTAGISSREEAEFDFKPHVEQLLLPHVFADAQAALAELRQQSSAELPTFTLGFCLGGTLSFLISTQDWGLSGIVGFYAGIKRSFEGYGTIIDAAPRAKVPALGLFGGDDPSIPPEAVEQLDQQLDKSGVPHTIITYPGAPHSFFDRRYEQFAEASADSWQRILRFIADPQNHD
jgi:carboxymethylenebutenolidase